MGHKIIVTSVQLDHCWRKQLQTISDIGIVIMVSKTLRKQTRPWSEQGHSILHWPLFSTSVAKKQTSLWCGHLASAKYKEKIVIPQSAWNHDISREPYASSCADTAFSRTPQSFALSCYNFVFHSEHINFVLIMCKALILWESIITWAKFPAFKRPHHQCSQQSVYHQHNLDTHLGICEPAELGTISKCWRLCSLV